ncbi:sigma 54-interacting transcriptional regulator, partial [Paraburkholderia sp. BR14261]
LQRVARVRGRDIPVLVLGRTGTGKEWLARALHRDSPRRDGPFVALNCAALPDTLIEAELFGYEDGAFTGAKRRGSAGKIAQAHGGTLFLDEIGDMPLAQQVRLMRVLQERAVVPLGGTRAVPVDLRIVCATHRDLRA